MSFDNLNQPKRKLNLFLLALLTFIAAAIAMMVPFIGLLGWALMPVPAILLILAERKRDAVICAVLGILVLLIFDVVLALVILAAILGIAFAYRRLGQEHAPPKRYIFYVSLILVGAGLAYIFLGSVVTQTNLIAQFIENYQAYVSELESDPLVAAYGSILGIDQEQIDQIIRQSRSMLLFIPYVMPGVWVAYMSFAALLNYAFSAWFGKRYEINLKKLPPLGAWDLPWYFVWGIIAGAICLLVPTFIEMDGTAFYALGANLIIIFGFAYFILGISVLWGLFARFKVPMLWRIVLLIVLNLFFGLILLIPLLGLLDIWINMRRLKRE